MVGADKVDENGEAKSKRRTSRPLAKAALIMDIVEATEDVAVAEVDTEDEVMVEMASLVEDVEDTAAEATRPLCNNRSLATNDLNDKKAFFALYQKSTRMPIFPFGFGSQKQLF